MVFLFLNYLYNNFYVIIQIEKTNKNMNKNLIRIMAVIMLMSTWIYIGQTLKDVLYIVSAIIILLATVDISKKKKIDVV
jgi:glucose-6-phosphate-specific signal transduction histidine kinase